MACSIVSDAKFDEISEDQSDMIWFCRHCRIALPGMKDILKSVNQLDKSHTVLMGKHDALERRVEVLEERNTEDSSLSMMDTIKEEVQEAMLMERKKTALIVRGVPAKGKDREEIKHILVTLEMTEEFKQKPEPTRLGKSNDRTKSRLIKIECETTDQKYMMLKRSKALARQESTRDVYIGPDLTRKERLANKDLREELNAKRARGEEENIAIRRNEIVTTPLLLVAPPLLAAPHAATPMSQAAASVAQAAAPAPKKLSTYCKNAKKRRTQHN